MPRRLEAAVIGATGVVGQQFVVALQGHPWFTISRLVASRRSAGKTYREALEDAGLFRWYCDEPPLEEALGMRVEGADAFDPKEVDLIFTALDAEEAGALEPRLAAHAPVISTASAFRYEEDVPILVPGVNMEHVKLIDVQREGRGWSGFIAPIPNCTATGLVITLKPIAERFGLDTVIMTSMQSVSGAGRASGVLALDIEDNVIPYIPMEEEKVQREAKKILGELAGEAIEPAKVRVSCTCTRVNVREGHTEAVFASTLKGCGAEEVKGAMRGFGKELARYELPSAPKEMILVLEDPSRPQPRLDRDTYGGMATVVGRVRVDEALRNGIKYVLLSHNTKMGAAKGAVLLAELLERLGYLRK